MATWWSTEELLCTCYLQNLSWTFTSVGSWDNKIFEILDCHDLEGNPRPGTRLLFFSWKTSKVSIKKKNSEIFELPKPPHNCGSCTSIWQNTFPCIQVVTWVNRRWSPYEKDEDIDNMTLITLIMNTLATAASY